MSLYQGKRLSLSVFGQSHGEAIGVSVDGFPAGMPVDVEAVKAFLRRRAPARNAYSTTRREPDEPIFVSGLYNGRTTGDALCAIIGNHDARSGDYDTMRSIPRPGHADFGARMRWGSAADLRGGGAFSGRLTAPLCIAGAVALQWLAARGITVGAHLASVGDVRDEAFDPVSLTAEALSAPGRKAFPTISDEAGQNMLSLIADARASRDSVGGVIEAGAVGLPAGWGGSLFDGVEAALARLIFSVPAVKGMEIGEGFGAARLRGSENNDPFRYEEGVVRTETNHHGGLLGGMTSGMPLLLRAAFKPTPSISRPQRTVDLAAHTDTVIEIPGRHDACIVPRAVPVIEACVALALFDCAAD